MTANTSDTFSRLWIEILTAACEADRQSCFMRSVSFLLSVMYSAGLVMGVQPKTLARLVVVADLLIRRHETKGSSLTNTCSSVIAVIPALRRQITHRRYLRCLRMTLHHLVALAHLTPHRVRIVGRILPPSCEPASEHLP